MFSDTFAYLPFVTKQESSSRDAVECVYINTVYTLFIHGFYLLWNPKIENLLLFLEGNSIDPTQISGQWILKLISLSIQGWPTRIYTASLITLTSWVITTAIKPSVIPKLDLMQRTTHSDRHKPISTHHGCGQNFWVHTLFKASI